MKNKKTFCLILVLFFPSIAFCKGILVELCGTDGAGKSTLSTNLHKQLTEDGLSVITISPALGDYEYVYWDKLAAPYLNDESSESKAINLVKNSYWPIWRDQQKKLIEDALEKYDFVILERYLTSHFVFKTASSYWESIAQNNFNTWPKASYTFFLSIPTSLTLERVKDRGIIYKKQLRVHQKNEEFLSKVQSIFSNIYDLYGDKHFIKIDATLSQEDVAQEVLNILYEEASIPL